jgi:2-iminobutanoate/2-iminopropanoate deaminase
MKKKTYPLMYAGKKQQFAKAVVVGDLVFLSGMSGRVLETGEVVSENLVDQVKVALDKVRSALTEVGTSMDNIVKTVIMLKNIEDHSTIRQIEREYWQKYAPRLLEEPPASTLMQVASLARPNMLIEVDVVALIPH